MKTITKVKILHWFGKLFDREYRRRAKKWEAHEHGTSKTRRNNTR